MPSSLHLRLMTPEDLPFADSVREMANWNQTRPDWERFLSMEPSGCFVAEWNGAPAGTAVTTFYGRQLGWIGMVLVHPNFRRRGIGRALLRRCIEYLEHRGARAIGLDATPDGKKLYDELGFHDALKLTRWEQVSFRPQTAASDARVRNWRDVDLAAIQSLDAMAFGLSRPKLVTALAKQSRCGLVLESEPGRIEGFGFLRSGSRALQLGPVSALSPEIAIRLIGTLISRTKGEKIFWDAPDENTTAAKYARDYGFTAQRSLTRMFLGKVAPVGVVQGQFALAGPEVG